jgi:hypothetical protein
VGFIANAVQSVAKALTPQNTFQAQGLQGTGNYTQQDFLNAIQQAQGQYGTNAANQNALAGTLQGQINGQGPNLATEQLKQGTNANISKTAAMIASQKGISPALAARQAADAAASANQTAAGQAAQTTAQQQLNAENAAGNLYGQIGNQAISQQGMLQNANAAQNAQLVNQNLSLQGVNAGVSAQNTQNTAGTMQGILGSAGKAATMLSAGKDATMLMGNKGGEIHPFHIALARLFADGGSVDPITGGVSVQGTNPFPWMNMSGFNKDANLFGLSGDKKTDDTAGANTALPGETQNFNQNMAGQVLAPSAGPDIGAGSALSDLAVFADKGAVVPGDGQIEGDSPENDTVPALLSPKEIVLPRSVTMSDDPVGKAADFVAAIKGKEKKGYGSVLEARRHFEEGMKHLKAMKGAS